MLFDIVPEHFFSPLAAPGKLVYWECIRKLYAIMSKQLSFGVEREILVDELEYYFSSSMAAELPPEEEPALTPRDQANQMLRRLEAWGWIYTETDYSYVQRVSFRDYAIQMIRTLEQIGEAHRTEYQGYIYTIYNLARAHGNPGLALTQIVENTDLLITGLKSLNANIKQYIDDLTRHQSVAEILDALLNDYYTNVVDKAYHRLMTSDNVSKFRPEILEQLEAKSRSKRYLHAAAKELAELQEIPEDLAEGRVLDLLHSVIDAFRQMDEILDQINKKNTRYQRAAINRARFLLTSGDDLRGQLKDIICALNTAFNEECGTDYNRIYELEETDRLIRIFAWNYLDIGSLYEPVQGRKPFLPQTISRQKPDPAMRASRRAELAKRLENVLSAERIDSYVHQMLGDRRQMRASELPLAEGDTFIRMIYIRLYGQRKNMSYLVEPLEVVELEGFRFRDFWIRLAAPDR